MTERHYSYSILEMPETTFFRDLAFVLLAALAGGVLAHLLRLPLFLGYIIGGALIGPFTPGPQISEPHFIQQLADIGVMLLMFTMGLEFSLKELLRVRAVALGGGLLGIIAMIGLFLSLRNLFGLSLHESLFIGSAISISSTMVVAKLLMEREQLNTEHGRLMIGTLLVEDLAVVVMLIVLPVLSQIETISATQLAEVGLALLKGLAILTPVLFLATRAVPPLLERIAGTRNFELFILVTLVLSLGTAVVTAQLGLSLAMGAFLAGMIIGESDFVHETLARILPLRDLFVVLFFVSIGMLIDPFIILKHWQFHLSLVGLVVVGKGLLRGLIVYLFRYPLRIAFLVTLGFTQIGEFSFVLARLGVNLGVIQFDNYNVLLASSLLTIFISTFLFRLAPQWWTRLSARFSILEPSPPEVANLNASRVQHVIICGYGRIGSSIGEALERFGIPQIVIESDRQIVSGLKDRGITAIYGSAANEGVCRVARPEEAALAVIALPDFFQSRQAFRNLKRLNPKLPILVRAHWDKEREELFREGVTEVIQPEFEGSLEMIRHALMHVGTPALQLETYLHELRQQRYSSLVQEWLHREDPTHRVQKIQEVEILPGSPFAGLSLRECKLRERTGVSVIQIRHKRRKTVPNPSADTVIEPGDHVLVMGTPSQVIEFISMSRAAS